MSRRSYLVIGGGIVGLAAAYKLLRTHPGVRVAVLEKERGVGRHQTGNNSGVLHAGLYYKPGSLKARLAVSGIRQMTAYCQEHGVPHEICGKVVVATTEAEVARLRDLYERGQQNGLTGLAWLDAAGLREIEPHAAGLAAVRVPEEGIVDYPAVCEALVRDIEAAGGQVVTGAEVRALRGNGGGWVAETGAGEFAADVIVNCAGLHCDRIAALAGERTELKIVPFRGEYYTLSPERQHLVRHLIYPVPDPAFPFLGVHYTRMIRGGVECGPNAVLAFAREGYRKSTVRVRDLADALAFPGLWRFLKRYPSMTVSELRRSFSRELFAASLQKLVPEVRTSDLRPGGAGVRAQAMLPNGDMVQDFYFISRPNALHVLNAPSPGATASLAIGDEIVRMLDAAAA
ncbi:MAG: L-2-hydroxyglutarate oxidase [uncultured Gemmatimonadaceae bacterium]|uniref:L-2-hydroxyglutarate oxidase n=1 Tax=uncultured Gemmatimonadaceae bacterium TaxID=246130 RepID=A0A6J4LHW6_9BACT|nr:MAG: L-2-hydroxyglutarate oxidase [uncultured Gemmatimonadaceae bacterium]